MPGRKFFGKEPERDSIGRDIRIGAMQKKVNYTDN